ncbi:Uncharacterised protein [Candidatus Norongarragalina meridionalis]|nr:Uncharacterised protein [Candidatus Norongarragalina meridionalis]
MTMKCVKCGKLAKRASLRIEGTTVPGWRCSCGEEYLDADAAERLLALRKLDRQKLTAKVTQQGNSFAVRLPMALFRALGMKDKETLGIKVDPSNPRSFTLTLY